MFRKKILKGLSLTVALFVLSTTNLAVAADPDSKTALSKELIQQAVASDAAPVAAVTTPAVTGSPTPTITLHKLDFVEPSEGSTVLVNTSTYKNTNSSLWLKTRLYSSKYSASDISYLEFFRIVKGESKSIGKEGSAVEMKTI